MSSPRFHIEPTSVCDIHRRSHWPLIKCQTIADDTSVAHNGNTSAGEVNNDFVKINPYQWKMSLNPDPVKQAKEIIFTRKISKEDQPPLVYEQCTRS